ncbi:MAG: heat shock protein transcriptional repressor HspR [Candidatus Methylomirabilis sp.]
MARQRRRRYSISIVAEMFDLHPQTLRTYEREGLIRPARTDGNTRAYSQEDVERIELILRLTKELGVNLAGVEVILNMRDRMEAMQRQVNGLLQAMAERFDAEMKQWGDHEEEGLVPVGRRGLLQRKSP